MKKALQPGCRLVVCHRSVLFRFSCWQSVQLCWDAANPMCEGDSTQLSTRNVAAGCCRVQNAMKKASMCKSRHCRARAENQESQFVTRTDPNLDFVGFRWQFRIVAENEAQQSADAHDHVKSEERRQQTLLSVISSRSVCDIFACFFLQSAAAAAPALSVRSLDFALPQLLQAAHLPFIVVHPGSAPDAEWLSPYVFGESQSEPFDPSLCGSACRSLTVSRYRCRKESGRTATRLGSFRSQGKNEDDPMRS